MLFNFTSNTEKKDLLELMEDKSAYTFFADEARDPFTYCNSDIYAKMIPLEKRENAVTKKRGFLKGRVRNGKKS